MTDRSTPQPLQLLQDQYDNALSCIRCGQCLSVCPTYQLTFAEEESPRGRIALARAVVEGALPLTPDLIEHSENCLLCEACTMICPAGVKMEPIGVAMRALIAAEAPTGGRQRRLRRAATRFALGSMTHFRTLCRLGWLYQRSGLRALLRASRLLRLLRLDGPDALLPEMPRRFLKARGQTWGPAGGSQPVKRVALFTGCVMSTAFAATTEATARLLARRGCEVVAVAGQGCCGALHLHGGDTEGAAALARQNVGALTEGGFDAIIVNSAGCGSTLKQYDHLLPAADPQHEAAAAFARSMRDLSEFLAELPPVPACAEAGAILAYQDPCHLTHAQRISRQPRTLLDGIAGATVREVDERQLCCGSAGVYNVLHPETGERLATRKLDGALAAGATTIVTANPGCLLHLGAAAERRGLALPVRHIADVLDEAERRAEAEQCR